ncbi:MAG: DnaA ATPase domain-containing protein, partial [Syntrophobacteria bacterium]
MDSLWPHVRRYLKETLSSDEFFQWIEPLRPAGLQSGHLLLQVPSRFHYDWVQERYLSLMQSCCRSIDSTVQLDLSMPVNRKPLGDAGRWLGNLRLSTRFESSQTFHNFLPGPFNRFAVAAARAVCEEDTAGFNPLFIEGPSGMGKSHLIHAIGNAWPRDNLGTAVYLNCRDLLPHEVLLLRAGGETLRHFLAGIGIFMVDDVHFVQADRNLQQYLLNIFDWCYDLEIQMVFTATGLPHHIPELTTALRSRLGWGLVTRIREPDLPECHQLVEKFLGRAEVPTSEDILSFFREQPPLNFHEIKDCVD